MVIFGACDDPFYAIVRDKKLLATYYMSCRGGMWQAGACVSEKQGHVLRHYFADNFREGSCLEDWEECGWTSTCASVGRDALLMFGRDTSTHILASAPSQFWDDAETQEQHEAGQKQQMTDAVNGYNEGEKRVERRASNS